MFWPKNGFLIICLGIHLTIAINTNLFKQTENAMEFGLKGWLVSIEKFIANNGDGGLRIHYVERYIFGFCFIQFMQAFQHTYTKPHK